MNNFSPQVADMLAYVNLGSDTQTVLSTDTASATNGNLDGVTLCGPRTYTITPATYSFLDLSGDTLTLQSTDTSETSATPITITISATLDNYAAITAVSQTFTIQILDHCDATTLSFSPAVTSMLAYVNLNVDTQTVPAID